MTFSILTSLMAYDDHCYIHLSSNVCKLVYYILDIPLLNRTFSVLLVYSYIVHMVCLTVATLATWVVRQCNVLLALILVAESVSFKYFQFFFVLPRTPSLKMNA